MSLIISSVDDSQWKFNGGNEFRFADFRSTCSPGQNTGRLNKTVKPLRTLPGY